MDLMKMFSERLDMMERKLGTKYETINLIISYHWRKSSVLQPEFRLRRFSVRKISVLNK